MSRHFSFWFPACVVTLLSTLILAQSAPPAADVTSYSAAPTTNYGSDPSLFVLKKGSITSNSYLKFDLSTLPAGASVSKATLRLYINQVAAPGSFDVFQLNSGWKEGGLTYSKAPALGTSATGNHPVSFDSKSLNQFVLVDITSLVQQWLSGQLSNNGLALALTTTSGGVAFDSKESINNSQVPELEIALNGPQGPPGPQGPGAATAQDLISKVPGIRLQNTSLTMLLPTMARPTSQPPLT